MSLPPHFVKDTGSNKNLALNTVVPPNMYQGKGAESFLNLFHLMNYHKNPYPWQEVNGWGTYADGAADPVDGTGGSSGLSFTRVTTGTPIRGVADFVWAPGGSGAAATGDGAYYPFTIDPADKGRMLEISFDYLIENTGYTDGKCSVWVYDITNSRLIQPVGYQVLNSTGVSKHRAVFQTSSDSVSYRLILHANSTTSTFSIRMNNFYIGRPAVSQGVPITDWQSYTCNISYDGTDATNITSETAYWRRAGDSMHVRVKVIFNGAANANGLFRIPLPSGYSMDSSKLPGNIQLIGVAAFFTNSLQYTGWVHAAALTTYVQMVRWDGSGGGNSGWAGNTTAGSNVPSGAAIANNDYITLAGDRMS
jgi:hypothetical protein